MPFDTDLENRTEHLDRSKSEDQDGRVAFERAKRLTILGVVWVGSRPFLKVALEPDLTIELPAVGLELSYRRDLTGDRTCIGEGKRPSNLGSVNARHCPNPPAKDQKLCTSCQIAAAQHAASLHHSHRTDVSNLGAAARDHLSQPNILYVAIFRDGSVKIGTSTETRIQTRLYEQGAWQAIQVARFEDGIAVRHAEDLVTSQIGLSQSVSVVRKLAGFIAPRAGAELSKTLAEQSAVVADFVAKLKLGAEIVNIEWSFEAVTWPKDLRLNKHPRLSVGAHNFSLIGVCGRVGIIQRPDKSEDDLFAVNLAELYGLELEVGRFEASPVEVQGALF